MFIDDFNLRLRFTSHFWQGLRSSQVQVNIFLLCFSLRAKFHISVNSVLLFGFEIIIHNYSIYKNQFGTIILYYDVHDIIVQILQRIGNPIWHAWCSDEAFPWSSSIHIYITFAYWCCQATKLKQKTYSVGTSIIYKSK